MGKEKRWGGDLGVMELRDVEVSGIVRSAELGEECTLTSMAVCWSSDGV